jgi:O-acetyl-ADP-ribose deacetylase (regulator of RNase III)
MAKQVVPIEAVMGDITTELVDAIVNAASVSLPTGEGLTGRFTGQPGRTCWRNVANFAARNTPMAFRSEKPWPPEPGTSRRDG